MNNFTFCSPTKFVFGRDKERQTGSLVAQFGGTKALIVYGGGSVVRSGLLDRVKQSLADAGIAWAEIGGIRPNPTDDRVYEGIAQARGEGCDFLLAVGGGSVIDTAKAIAAGVPYDGDFWDFYAGKATVVEALPVGVVLTIPAAGSEGSGHTVITKLDGLMKLGLCTDLILRPVFSVLNPELTFTLPAYQTACGVVDMMTHIFERYFSNTTGCEVTDRLAEGLLTAIMTEAPRAIAEPANYDARANIMWAGTLAHNDLCGLGREEDWASHNIEHELSAIYDVAHGAGLAVVNTAWMSYVCLTNPTRGAQMAVRVMGVAPENKSDLELAQEGIARLRDFYRSIGMPVTLAELVGPDADVERLVTKAHEHFGETFGGYKKLSVADTAEIYRHMA